MVPRPFRPLCPFDPIPTARPWRLATHAALAGLVLGLIAPGAAAQTVTLGARTGAAVQPLLGVNVGPGPQGEPGNVDLTAAYQARGVTLVRTHDYYGPLDMATLYPDRARDPLQQASYNFSGVLDSTYQRSSDSVFAAILAGGFEPYFRIGDSYNNVKPPTTAAERANWAQAAVQVLRHYREGLWGGKTSNFRFAEIGNEPDNAQFWPSPRTTEEFNLLFDATAKALRAAFPTLKIGGPGWAPGGCLATAGQAKVRSLLDHVKAQGTPLDFMSFHVYGSDSTLHSTCAQFYRTELDSRGLQAVELHITEWNTPSGSAGSSTGQLRHNAQGAAYMTAAWITLQKAGVAQSTFYRGSDPAPDAGEFYGMFYGDGRPKKIADAFTLWRDFSAYRQQLQSTGAPSGTTVLAADDAGGARALLVANPGTAAASISPAFADGKTVADYRVSVSTVSDGAEGVVTTTASGSSVSVPAKATVLMRFTPRAAVFAATASGSGSTAAYTLAVSASLAAADVGNPGQIFVAALVGGRSWYAFNGQGWVPWSTGDLPAAFKGNLPPSWNTTAISAFPIGGLTGTPIYVGYGSSADEMIRAARYQQVHVLP